MSPLEVSVSILVALVLLVLGEMLRRTLNRVNDVQQEFWRYKVYVAEHYVHRDPFKDFMIDVTSKLDRIFEKLDGKADKPDHRS